MAETKSINSEQKIWAAVGYLWILSVVVLAARKKNEFIKFHASQGLLMFIASVIMMFIPVVGWLINLAILVLSIMGIWKALQGEKWELPVLSNAAQSFGDWLIKTLKL